MRKVISLTESDIHDMIYQTLCEATGQPVEVDNFDKFASIMDDLTGTDGFYFVQIFERRKDNDEGSRYNAANTCGFNYCHYWECWQIHSGQELLEKKPEIVQACLDHENADPKYGQYYKAGPNAGQPRPQHVRAMIRLQPRSHSQVEGTMARYGVDIRKSSPQEIAFSMGKAAGYGDRHLSNPRTTMATVDVDNANPSIHDKVEELLKQWNVTIVTDYLSPNGGKHFVVKADQALRSLNKASLSGQVNMYGPESQGGLDAGIVGDAPEVLYCKFMPNGYHGH